MADIPKWALDEAVDVTHPYHGAEPKEYATPSIEDAIARALVRVAERTRDRAYTIAVECGDRHDSGSYYTANSICHRIRNMPLGEE